MKHYEIFQALKNYSFEKTQFPKPDICGDNGEIKVHKKIINKMTISSPSSNLPASNEENTADIVALLRSLLSLNKKKIDQKFADEINCKVNLLIIKLHKETDEVLAYQCLGLIGVAIVKGSKSAVKQKIRLLRWINTVPPALNLLANDDERIGAVKLLWQLKASWKIFYTLKEAVNTQTSKALANELVKLAISSSTTYADLVKELSKLIQTDHTTDVDHFNQVFRLVAKFLPSREIESGSYFGQEFSNLASAVVELCQRIHSSSKVIVEIQKSILIILETISAREPTTLLSEKTIQGLTTLSRQPGGLPKKLQKYLSPLSSRIVSIVLQHVKMYGMNNTIEVRQLLVFSSYCLPIEKLSEKFISDRELFKKILLPTKDPATEESHELSAHSGIQEHIAALLISWYRYCSELPDSSVVNEVSALINLVASKAKIEMYGSKGDLVQYQPLQHFLGDSSAQLPTNVRIEIPGVRLLRSDNSQRVLTRALVFSVS